MTQEEVQKIVLDTFAGFLEGDTGKLYTDPDVEIDSIATNTTESLTYMMITSALEDKLNIVIDVEEMSMEATTPRKAVEYIKGLM